MKKLIIILGVCVLLAGMPAMTAISIPKMKNLKRTLPIFEKITANEDDAPYWAEGTFNGTWGLREFLFLRMIEIEIGNISGYYGTLLGPIKVIKGEFYPHWNHSKVTNITGVYFGAVIFGTIGDVDLKIDQYNITTNETNYVGLGDQNETRFDWRIMGRQGPTFYMKATISKLE